MATSIAAPVAFDPERYRTFWERFWAGAIDGVVLSVPFGLLHYFLFPLASWSGGDGRVGSDRFQLWLACCVFLHWRYGQTVGKRFMGVKVLDVSEKRVSRPFCRHSSVILGTSSAMA